MKRDYIFLKRNLDLFTLSSKEILKRWDFCPKKSYATLSFNENMERENLFGKKENSEKEEFCEKEFSAADTDNVSHTVAVSTAGEALVGCAVSCTHVVLLVPDLSLACGVRHGPMFAIPIMVVPRPDFKLSSTVGLEEHCLRSKRTTSPLDDIAVQSSFSEVITTLRRGNIC